MNEVTKNQIKKVIQLRCIDAMGKNNIPAGWDLDSIAKAVHDNCKAQKVDYVLCLSQGIAESHWGINPNARRSRLHRNIFNWLNTDDGQNHTFATFEEGIKQYCITMGKEYMWPSDQDADSPGWVTLAMMLRHNFERPKGGRYASSPDYVRVITKLSQRINEIIRQEASNAEDQKN